MRRVRTALTLALGVLAAAPAGAAADVRTIRFGGELGNRYEPAELTVQAGDIVEWTGDFAAHPLRYRLSPSDPFGAPYPGPSPFRRTLSAPGDRVEYVCALHGDEGMRGVVTAVAKTGARPLTRPPLLRLKTEPAEPVAGAPVTFVASYVEGTGDMRYTSFAWDLDGDGKVKTRSGPDRITKDPRVTTTYAQAGRRKMSVTGRTDEPSAAGQTTTTLKFIVAASADNTAPVVDVVSLAPSSLAELLRSGLQVTLRGSEVARAQVTLFDGARVLARGERRIAPDPAVLRMRVSDGGAEKLRGKHDVRLKLRIVARDDAGNRMTLRKVFIAR